MGTLEYSIRLKENEQQSHNNITFNFQGTSVITPIIPLLFVLVPAVYLASNSTENILETNSLRFIMTFGLIGSKITNKLIVSNNDFKRWNVIRE